MVGTTRPKIKRKIEVINCMQVEENLTNMAAHQIRHKTNAQT